MKKLICTLAFTIVSIFTCHATILMHEGFPGGATGYKSTPGTGDLKGSDITTNAVFGFSATKWQNSGTSAVYDMGLGSGLTLPASFSGLPSAAYLGSNSAGLKNSATSSDERLQWKPLTTGLLNIQSGKIAFRFLMSADSTALNAHVSGTGLTSGNYYGAGLVLDGSIQNSSIRTTSGRELCFVFRKDASGQHLSFVLKGGGESQQIYDLLVPEAGSTYLCYAEISVNAGMDAKEQIKVFAQNVTSYDPAAPFFTYNGSDVFEAQLIDATTWPTHLVLGGHYGTNNGEFKVDEFALASDPDDIMVIGVPGAPTLEACALVKNSGNYIVTGIVTEASATVGVIAEDDAGNVLRTMSLAETAEDNPFSVTFAETFLTNTTYRLSAIATNGVGAVTNAVGTIYSGELSIAKVKDADEYKCVPGEVTVSRAETEDLELVVYYSFDSLVGTEGTDWVVPSGPVTIPAGSASATIYLTPKVNAAITEGYTVTMTLEAGNYAVPSPATVDLTIKNLVAPAGYNTWVAATDGQASVAGNWSEGRVPNSSDNILFDGDLSNANCEWDGATLNGPSSTVASWTMTSVYTGTVTICTMYPEVAGASFTNFTVSGDMAVSGGKITQVANAIQKEEYRLRLAVGGNLTIGAAGKIDVTGCGPRGVMTGRTANTYGGDNGTYGKTYGDPKLPYCCGSGNNGNWPSSYKGAGGGAAWIEVDGNAVVNGSILSEGQLYNSDMSKFNGTSGNITTSGGSVYLRVASLSGTGRISAKADRDQNTDNQSGSGGRVAVVLTSTAYDPAVGSVTLQAYARPTTSGAPGHGTVVVKNPGEENGTLLVVGMGSRGFSYNNTQNNRNQLTSIPAGQTWTFDKVIVGDFGIISVGDGTTLNLPNGWASVSAKNTSGNAEFKRLACGIVYRGGSLTVPKQNAKHEFKGGNWTFHPAINYVLDADTEISGGASIGTMYLSAGTNMFLVCDLKVAGNLNVKTDGYLNANCGGLGGNGGGQGETYTAYPILSASAYGTGHGGQNGSFPGNFTYGSFFNPQLPGSAAGHADHRNVGGGVLKVEVVGTLNVDGRIRSNSTTFGSDSRPAGAGSILIQASTLIGAGGIEANAAPGYYGTYPKNTLGFGPSSPGRIAVRLIGEDAAFSEFWQTNILAKGYTYTGALNDGISSPTNSASAGSIYLQTAAQGEKGGTIIIRNDGVVGNLAWTPIPSSALGDSAADFKKASLSLAACGKARLFETLQAETLSMESDTVLDVNGKTLVVRTLQTGGENVPSGTYAAGSALFTEGYVTDSAGGGSVVVLGASTLVVIR